MNLKEIIKEVKSKLGIKEPFWPTDSLSSYAMNYPRMLGKLAALTNKFNDLLDKSAIDRMPIEQFDEMRLANIEAHLVGNLEKRQLAQKGKVHVDRTQEIICLKADAKLNATLGSPDGPLLHGLTFYISEFSVSDDTKSMKAGDIACDFATEEGYHQIIFTRLEDQYGLFYVSQNAPDRVHTSQGLWKGAVSELSGVQSQQTISILDNLDLSTQTSDFLIQPMRMAIEQISKI